MSYANYDLIDSSTLCIRLVRTCPQFVKMYVLNIVKVTLTQPPAIAT